jgi:hypothetical protein
MTGAASIGPEGAEDRSAVESMGVRALIGELAAIEDELRGLQPFVAVRGRLIPNPERRNLVIRQARVVGALRQRRRELRSSVRRPPS